MRLIMFCSRSGDCLAELRGELRDRLGAHDVVFLDKLSDLQRTLNHLDPEPQAACLIVADKPELESILGLRHLLEPLRLAVVVPDDHDQTLRLAHRMRPRYLTASREVSSLAAVLERMTGAAP